MSFCPPPSAVLIERNIGGSIALADIHEHLPIVLPSEILAQHDGAGVVIVCVGDVGKATDTKDRQDSCRSPKDEADSGANSIVKW